MDSQVDEAIKRTLHRKSQVDYLLVADRAEVVNNKLYMMGGGWDRIQPQEFPFDLQIGIALGVRIPYNETDDTHHLAIELTTGESQSLMKIEADLQTGRAPGMGGMDALVPMAFNGAIRLTEPGTLVLSAVVDSQEPRRHEIKAVKRGG